MENEFNPQVLVASNEQITIAYPDLFEKHNIDILPIHIEKNYEFMDNSNEPRMILLPSGIVSIISKDNQDFIWGNYNTEEYKDLLTQLNLKAGYWSKVNNPNNTLSYEETINNKSYVINFFPHNDARASTVLIDTLDKKVNNIKSKLDLKK